MSKALLTDILSEKASYKPGKDALDERVQSKLSEVRKEIAGRIFS